MTQNRKKYVFATVVLLLPLAIISCGNSSSGSNGSSENSGSFSSSYPATNESAARLLTQASFGLD